MTDWLGELSYFLGVMANFAFFAILFVPRMERKKANIILGTGFFIMFTVHQVLMNSFGMSAEKASLLSMSIPSLLLCLSISKYRDGRFLFTFCFADILYAIIRILSVVLSNQFDNAFEKLIVEFGVKLGLLGIMILIAWKERKVYERILETLEKGWNLLACESACFYVFFYLLLSYTDKLGNRVASRFILLFYCFMVLITFLVIFRLIIQMNRTQKEEEKNQLLETQLKLKNSELIVKQLYQEMAYKDQLTGVANRAAFEERIQREATKGQNVVLFLFDIDGLKRTNDTWGHREGDYLIKNITAIIQDVFEPFGTTYRIGGDEIVVLADGTDFGEPPELIEQVKCNLSEAKKNIFSEKPYDASVSAGFAVIEEADEKKMENGLIQADSMMYLDKRREGNERK